MLTPWLDGRQAHEVRRLAFLLEQRGLEAHDLWPVLGSKSRVSEILSGKRAISKAQAKKLAAFFHVPLDLFI
jgi:HTH-type transcriptional regulator/antitoxin HigA